MAAHPLPGIGLIGGRAAGEDGWADEMNSNLFRSSVLTQLVVKSRVAALPGSPAEGDIHILTTDNRIAARDAGAWVYLTPSMGWRAYVVAETLTVQFDGGAWVAGATAIAAGGTGATTAQAAAAALSVGWVAARSGTAVSLTGTTAETVLATINIPAGAIGLNGTIEIIPLFTFTGTAGVKTTRIRFGSAEVWSNANAATVLAIRTLFAISNSGSLTSQVALNLAAGVGTTANAAQIIRTSINTANPVAITITAQLANAADTAVLESYLVRITYGA